MYLKRYSHQALLDIFYRQSKNIKDTQITYNKNTQLRIAYWPAYTGNLILSIGSQGLEISHIPHLENSISFSKEISEMLHQAISVYKKQRLLNLFPRGRYDKRLYITLRGEECMQIDISYFTGEFLVFVHGKYSNELSTKLKSKKMYEIFNEVDEKILQKQVESICRSLGRELIQEPLRFCRCLYSQGPMIKRKDVLGYIDLGSMLPTDTVGHMVVFAMRIIISPLSSELVGFNDTEEEYCIFIMSQDNLTLESFLKNSLRVSKERITLMRIPIMLLAKMDI